MADPFSPPRTQYNRNLTIRIEGGGPTDSFTFSIKPGEFQSDHPARMSTTQTLQGVYQDFGGMGVQKLVYQGHTGWRRLAPNAPHDGFEVFKALYNETYLSYHKRIQAANDPSEIKCTVIDDLYDTVYIVSLDDFQATKSKSSPLLYHYTLRMTVISDETGKTKPRDPVDYVGLSFANSSAYDAIRDLLLKASDALSIINKYKLQALISYQVKQDDSLQSIAVLYNVDPLLIAQLNGLQPPYIFNAGTILSIPNRY
jgi:hypothetical protein